MSGTVFLTCGLSHVPCWVKAAVARTAESNGTSSSPPNQVVWAHFGLDYLIIINKIKPMKQSS